MLNHRKYLEAGTSKDTKIKAITHNKKLTTATRQEEYHGKFLKKGIPTALSCNIFSIGILTATIDAIKQIDRAWGFKHRVVYFTFQAPRAGWYRVGIGIEATTFAAGTCISNAIAVGFVDKILINY